MNPGLLAALINQIALPELTNWLRSRHEAGQTITDADIIAKLAADTDLGIKIGSDWLSKNPS